MDFNDRRYIIDKKTQLMYNRFVNLEAVFILAVILREIKCKDILTIKTENIL